MLGEATPAGLAAARMMITDYARRYENIDATLTRALPMIEKDADPSGIGDDWLTSVFEHIGGVSEPTVQELWARLLAQESNRPGHVPKRAVAKLALMDRQATRIFRELLRNAVTSYMPWTAEPEDGRTISKIGRFAFPLFDVMRGMSDPRPDADLSRMSEHFRDSIGAEQRKLVRWLADEGLVRQVSANVLDDGYLDPRHWRTREMSPLRWPLAFRVGMGKIFECDVRQFWDLVRRSSNGGLTSQVLQLTDLAELLLDPRIRELAPVRESSVPGDDWTPAGRKAVQRLLRRQLKPTTEPRYGQIAENPGHLHPEEQPMAGIEYYYYVH